ncbi:type III PLP-dependent enzyme [Herbidospora mongoliensis]|uniref:type III PLP-dependent enzyme n=1 Tax=Herbidospora mongoliensis TaxID=688067 RepID=UPI0008321F14|nr:type III PLP-dependent enzyme [Herbidospora mongoliensis]
MSASPKSESAILRTRAYASTHHLPSPSLLIDLPTVAAAYRALAEAFPRAGILYAVKANAAPEVISTLAELGSGFDVASIGEVERCLSRGVPGRYLSYSNCVKKAEDIAAAYRLGVRTFAFDNPRDLAHIARWAPRSNVFCRIAVSPPDAVMPFGGKFGCDPDTAPGLLADASAQGLRPLGITWHVGSQQCNPDAWDVGIAAAAKIALQLESAGIRLPMINIGGGLPISYGPSPAFGNATLTEVFGQAVDASMNRHFGSRNRPRLVLEPGRAMVGAAGIIRSEVVTVREGRAADLRRWVFLDVGRYNGLVETEREAIAYRLRTPGVTGPTGPVVLAGPTSDGDDVLYQRTGYELPLALAPGDVVEILDAGAYTSSYSCAAVNGLPALPTFCVEER